MNLTLCNDLSKRPSYRSIFFITTYFADYILVPTKSRGQVVSALEQRGFVFEKHTDAFVNPSHHHQSSAYQHHQRNQSSSSSVASSINIINNNHNNNRPPQTPPPSNLDELQLRTFSLLKRQNVVPSVDASIRLIQCAGRKDTGRDGRSAHMQQLQLGLAQCLVGRPRFLSLTLTDAEPASVLVEKRLLRHFRADEDVLLGTRQDVLVPIILDLRGLPLESTGIVCGVAGRLVGAANALPPFGGGGRGGFGGGHAGQGSHEGGSAHGSGGGGGIEPGLSNGSGLHAATTGLLTYDVPAVAAATTTSTVIDMSYLSTVRAGTVMVSEADLQKATEALRL